MDGAQEMMLSDDTGGSVLGGRPAGVGRPSTTGPSGGTSNSAGKARRRPRSKSGCSGWGRERVAGPGVQAVLRRGESDPRRRHEAVVGR